MTQLLETPLVAQRVLVGAVARLAEAPGRSLEVLRCEYRRDVRGDKAVGAHLIGVEPQTHGVGGLAEGIGRAHTLHALHRGDDVDVGVVGQELRVVASVRAAEGVDEQHAGLALLRRHPYTYDVGR